MIPAWNTCIPSGRPYFCKSIATLSVGYASAAPNARSFEQPKPPSIAREELIGPDCDTPRLPSQKGSFVETTRQGSPLFAAAVCPSKSPCPSMRNVGLREDYLQIFRRGPVSNTPSIPTLMVLIVRESP